jgi:transposase
MDITHEQKLGRNGALTPVSVPPDSEVKPKRTRRTFTAQQKLKILVETDSLSQGEIGAFLRRKGIYWSHLTKWRKQRDEGLLAGLEPKKRGCVPLLPEVRRVSELERENLQLRGRLDRAEKIIDVQKKLCELFGVAPAKRDDLG